MKLRELIERLQQIQDKTSTRDYDVVVSDSHVMIEDYNCVVGNIVRDFEIEIGIIGNFDEFVTTANFAKAQWDSLENTVSLTLVPRSK